MPISLPKRIRRCVLSIAAAAGLIFSSATPSSALCTDTGNCFVGADIVLANDDDQIGADGVYAVMYTIFGMDVRIYDRANARYFAGTEMPAGSNYYDRLFSVRAVQLADQYYYPQFIGAGYTAGCGRKSDINSAEDGCTTLNSKRGINKEYYMDGFTCSQAAGCKYFVEHYDIIEGGTAHGYQLHRNKIGDAYAHRLFIDGNYKGTAYTSMERAEATMAAEKPFVNSGGLSFLDPDINMTQDYWRNIGWHRKGAASTYPPSTANYTAPPKLKGYLDFKSGERGNCKYFVTSNTQVGTSGRC